jgi:hypothetical protein
MIMTTRSRSLIDVPTVLEIWADTPANALERAAEVLKSHDGLTLLGMHLNEDHEEDDCYLLLFVNCIYCYPKELQEWFRLEFGHEKPIFSLEEGNCLCLRT